MPLELIQEQSRCIAHEIRNQVSICDVYCEIVKKHLDKAGVENESIDKALDCIQRSVKMINNSLIDLKSLNNLQQSSCDIAHLIEESVDLSQVYIQDKQINMITNIRGNGRIFVDENKFLACMINLVKNAIEAIETTGEIIISSEIVGKNVLIKISNNGKPITPTAQKDLFNEGYTTKRTGSGLGLYICKNNLERQNAKLTLTHSSPKKTEFEIKIPLE